MVQVIVTSREQSAAQVLKDHMLLLLNAEGKTLVLLPFKWSVGCFTCLGAPAWLETRLVSTRGSTKQCLHIDIICICADLLIPLGTASWHRLCVAWCVFFFPLSGYFQQPQGETVTDATLLCPTGEACMWNGGGEHCITSGCHHGDSSWEGEEFWIWLSKNETQRNPPHHQSTSGIPCARCGWA